MRKWPVTDIMQQNGNTGCLGFFATNFNAFCQQGSDCLLHQVKCTERVIESCMRGTRIDILGKT